MLCFPLQNHYLSPQYWAYFELSALADIWDQSPNEFLETLLGKQTRGKVWRFSCLLLLKFSKKYFKVSTKWWPITNLYQRHSLSLFGYILEKKSKKKYVTFCLDAVPKPLPIVYTGLNAPFKNHPRSKKQNLKEDVLFCVQYLWESLAFLFAFQICFETRLLNLFQTAELRNKV